MSQVQYKEIQDLTEEFRKVTENIYRFPRDLIILNAKLLEGSDGRRHLYIEYEFDKLIFKKEITINDDLGSLIVDTVFKILIHYISMHLE